MKKFIMFILVPLLIAMTSMGCSSCSNNNEPWGIEYNLQSDGTTDANVAVQFFNAQLTINGDADYQFAWTNVAPDAVFADRAINLDEAAATGEPVIMQAADYVNSWFDSWFKVLSFDGNYDIYIKGYIKETKTQITFSIDRHFTNAPTDAEAEAPDIDPE